MMMQRVSPLQHIKVLVCLMAISLGLPPPAFALRQLNAGMEESPVNLEVRERLGVQTEGAARSSGLEENWDSHPDVRPILAGYLNPDSNPGLLYGATEPESIRDHVQRVLRIAQLISEDMGLEAKDRKLLRIATALHDIGTYQHSNVESASTIVRLAGEKILNPDGRPIPFRTRDLIDHYKLTWETSGQLLELAKKDLAGRSDLSAGETLDEAVAQALAARGVRVDFEQGDPILDRIRDDETAVQILQQLVRQGQIRFDEEGDQPLTEAIVRASVWAGLLETQPAYANSLGADVAHRAARLAEILEAADVVEASCNLSLSETFYRGAPQDLANLNRWLHHKVEKELAFSAETAGTVIRLLSPEHPLHGEFMGILNQSRRIGQAGQVWSDLDQEIMGRVRQGAGFYDLVRLQTTVVPPQSGNPFAETMLEALPLDERHEVFVIDPLRVLYRTDQTGAVAINIIQSTLLDAQQLPGFQTDDVDVLKLVDGQEPTPYSIVVKAADENLPQELIWRKNHVAVITITPQMTFAQLIQEALSQWTGRTVGEILQIEHKNGRLGIYA